MTAPTGEQHVLTRPTPHGPARAVITELAATLRELSIGGIHLTQPYSEQTLPPFACGIVLVPWPNRVEDGRWMLDGAPQQLDITEPSRNNAIHGLLRNSPYRLADRTASSITLAAAIHPQHGYPFHLDTSVTYTLVDGGIDVTHSIRNLSEAAAPVAVGAHTFLTIGDVPADELELVVHGSTRFEVDDRLNPIAESSVAGTEYDLRAGRRLAELSLDDAFGGLELDGGVAALVRAPDGREVRLRLDEHHPYVQVFTTRAFPTPSGQSLAVAVEPMTAPANAFNSGRDLRWLRHGEQWTVGWGIEYSG